MQHAQAAKPIMPAGKVSHAVLVAGIPSKDPEPPLCGMATVGKLFGVFMHARMGESTTYGSGACPINHRVLYGMCTNTACTVNIGIQNMAE